jgi:hypothetical protein
VALVANFSAKTKAFRAEAQSRREHKEIKAIIFSQVRGYRTPGSGFSRLLHSPWDFGGRFTWERPLASQKRQAARNPFRNAPRTFKVTDSNGTVALNFEIRANTSVQTPATKARAS